MDQSPESFSGDNSENVDSILELGDRALEQLSAQAEFARVQARRAELELIVRQARHGQIGPLRNWLQLNQKLIAVDEPHGTSEPGAAKALTEMAGTSTTCANESVGQVDRNWDKLRDLSRQRSADRESSRADIQPANQETIEPAKIISSPQHSTEYSSSAGTMIGGNTATDKPVSPKSQSSAELASSTKLPLKQQHPTAAPVKPVKSVPMLDRAKLKEVMSSEVEPKDLGYKRLAGVIVSSIAHVLLLVALGFVTIHVPIDAGMFAFEASSASEQELDSFEISSEVSVDVPSESEEVAMPVENTNLTDALSDFGEPVSQSLSQPVAASPSSVISKSAITAAKMVPSKNVMSFYGASAAGNSFCFVIDGSGSMRGGAWEAARVELLRSISLLKPSQRFHVIFFNKEMSIILEPGSNKPAESALYATDENKQHAQQWLGTLQIAPGGPPINALETALAVECDGIYFLADGEMTENTANHVLEMLRKKNRTYDLVEGEIVMTPIHTIAYYSDKGLAIMKRIAEENRGQFAYVPKPRK